MHESDASAAGVARNHERCGCLNNGRCERDQLIGIFWQGKGTAQIVSSEIRLSEKLEKAHKMLIFSIGEPFLGNWMDQIQML